VISPTFEKEEVGKPVGRLISDFKAGGVNECTARGLLGAVHYARVVPRFFEAIVRARRRHPRRRVLVWRGDVSGAFTLVRIDPAHAGLFAHVIMVEGVLCAFLPLCGTFGGCAFPQAWDVVSAAIEADVRARRLDAVFVPHRLDRLVRTTDAIDADDPTLPGLPDHVQPLPEGGGEGGADGGQMADADVYVDDFLQVASDVSHAGVRECERMSNAFLHAVDAVLEPPPEGGGGGDQGEAVSTKKMVDDAWLHVGAPALGMVIDTRLMEARLSPEREATLRGLLTRVIEDGAAARFPLLFWQRLSSHVSAAAQLLPGAAHFATPIWDRLAGDAGAPVGEAILENAIWWRGVLDDGKAAGLEVAADLWRWHRRAPDLIIETDASRHGAGGVVLSGEMAGAVLRLCWPRDIVERLDAGVLTVNDTEFATSVLELMTVGDGGRLRGLLAAVLGDNSCSVTWLRGRAARGRASNALARLLVLWLREHGVDIDPSHIAGVINVVADALSRGAAGNVAGLRERESELSAAELKGVHALVCARCDAHHVPHPPACFQVRPPAAALEMVLAALRC
jgi:hypothetical protein